MYINLRMGLASEYVGTASVLLQLWIRILMTHWTVQIAQSERRCYCNDVTCVTTGYMCKSSLGICFSQTTHDGATRVRFYHACAEMLSDSHASACAGVTEVGSRVTARSEGGPDDGVKIVCCSSDMCNYGESQQRLPSTNHNNPQTDEGSHFVHHSPGDHQRASADRHIWFQALVIAVSLIGTVVLLFLLVVTVKILVLNQRRRTPPVSRPSKSEEVLEGSNSSLDERVRCHVIGPEAEMDRSYCCCYEEEEEEGTRDGRKVGKGDRLMGCGKMGGDVGGKVYPVSYQCVAFTAGESAFRTDLVPYHHHHAYLLHHHHHCRHFTHHHHHPHRYPLFTPHEKCRCPNNDIQRNETLPKTI